MRTPAALVSIPLLVGSVAGILLCDAPDPWLPLSAAGAAVLALIAGAALVAESAGGAAVAVVLGCAAGGVSLGASAARAAYRPPLLSWFESRGSADTVGADWGSAPDARRSAPELPNTDVVRTGADGFAGATERLARRAPPVPAIHRDPVLIEGVLREDAALLPFGASIVLDVHCADSRGSCNGTSRMPRRSLGGVRLSVSGVSVAERAGEWRAGRTIRLPASLRLPPIYGDPGVPDDVRALARRGIVLVGSVKSAALVELREHGSRLEEAAASARAWSRRALARYIGCWSAQSGAIAAAILIGDRSGLSEQDERRLQEAGTYHVIAISGGNIALLTAMLLAAMRILRVPHHVASAGAIGVLLFYGQLAAGGASVSRAVTAACVYLAGRMLDQRGPPLNALAIAAASGVAVSPLAAFDGGFLLSFGAALGILLGAPRLRSERRDANQQKRQGVPDRSKVSPNVVARPDAAEVRQSHPSAAGSRISGAAAPDSVAAATREWSRLAGSARSALVGLFVATVCAELALAPLGAALFSRITFAGLILNFAAIPLMAIAQTGAMATLAAAPVAGWAARGCGYVTHLAASGIVRSAGLVDVAPWLSRDVPPPAWWLVGVYYASCIVILTIPRHSRVGLCGIAASAALMLAGPPATSRTGVPARAPGTLRVVFLDVGQGDATVVILPDGRTLLVDAGGLAGSSFDIGDRIVGPSLRALGVRRLEALVLTHGDPDHIGGAPAALRNFAPRAIWEGVPVPPHGGLRELRALAADATLSWRTVQAGDREAAGAVEIRVLHPPPPEWERQRVRNDDSVVIELRIGVVSIVLPGDIGLEGERLVAPRLDLGAVTIVKAPHHGSGSSSTPAFIGAAHPSAVVFSEGRGNRFGHPAPAVMARYRAAEALVFRTDEDGAIVMDTDGKTVAISTWSGRHLTLPR